LSTPPSPLPPAFLQHLAELEATYLHESDPMRQSGFSGGAERWRAERAPILQAIPTGGDLLDIGCANGYLLVANAWGWTPPRRFQYVYSVFDCVPRTALDAFVEQLMKNVVAPGGRLILGAYGSRSRREPPAPIDVMLTDLDYEVAGSATAGTPETARFAWIDNP
jgi:hypothetical protein